MTRVDGRGEMVAVLAMTSPVLPLLLGLTDAGSDTADDNMPLAVPVTTLRGTRLGVFAVGVTTELIDTAGAGAAKIARGRGGGCGVAMANGELCFTLCNDALLVDVVAV